MVVHDSVSDVSLHVSLCCLVLQEGDEIIDGSYARIQHLVSGRYLHVQEESEPSKHIQIRQHFYCMFMPL